MSETNERGAGAEMGCAPNVESKPATTVRPRRWRTPEEDAASDARIRAAAERIVKLHWPEEKPVIQREIGDDDPIAKLFTLKQAARKLGITTDQVRGFVDDGELQYINAGRGKKYPRLKFTDADLDDFIERRRRKSTPCLTNRKSHRTTASTLKSEVIGFTALRNAQLAKTPKSLKR
jgi:hypothetical protein